MTEPDDKAVESFVKYAMKEVRDEGGDPSNDAAVQMILDQLCFLCNMPQPSFLMENWERVCSAVEKLK